MTITSSAGFNIARVFTPSATLGPETMAECQANATLIAAAPVLYEALYRIERALAEQSPNTQLIRDLAKNALNVALPK